MMDDGIPSPSSDSVMISKEEKNRRATAKIQIKIHFLSLKEEDDTLFKNREKPAFVLRLLKAKFKNVVGRLSLQQLEYEMDFTDLPDDYNFF